ncbi:hypothetical protein Tco_0781880, partial [Tanacetum coccineum]
VIQILAISFEVVFFNGHESSGKKASWVQWKKALAPKDNGGLDSRGGLKLTQVEEFSEKRITLWCLLSLLIHASWTLNTSVVTTVASSRNMIDSRLFPKV